MINKDTLLALSGQFPEFELVDIQGFGQIKVKVLTVSEFDAMDVAVSKEKMGNRTALLRYCVMEDNGAATFDDDDISKIEGLPRYLVEPIVDAAMRMNKMRAIDQEALAKNSSGQSDGSSSV